jgi:adenine-specific DNA-methyltransferase
MPPSPLTIAPGESVLKALHTCEMTTQLSQLSEDQKRRSLGIYYTPSNAAHVFARWLIRDKSDTVLEPSFGGCSLLEAAVMRLRALGCRSPARQLSGYDVDSGAFAYLARLLGDLRELPQFSKADFLSADPEKSKAVTAVIANPPFVSWHRMNDAQRSKIRQWRERYTPHFPMTASLWAYFLVHAAHFVKPNGRLSFVLPAAALTADYAQEVLRDIAGKFTHILVCRLNEQLFIQAGAQEKAVMLFAEGRLSDGDQTSQALIERTVSSLDELQEVLSGDLRQSNRALETPFPQGAAAALLGELHDRGKLCRIGDYHGVTIGEVVGDTSFFVKTVSEWEAVGVESRSFEPLVTRTRQLAGLVLDHRDIKSRYSPVPRLFAIRSRGAPKLALRYLDTYPIARRRANVTFAKRSPWYAVSYSPDANAFIGSLSHDFPHLVLNRARVSCSNGLYKLRPLAGMAWRPAVALASLSTIALLSAELYGRGRGSGALKLEPSDIARMLLPANYADLQAVTARDLIRRADTLMRTGEKAAASRLADESLLISAGILKSSELTQLRRYLSVLRQFRLQRGGSVSPR